jgi:hypothetical protein
MEKHISAVMDDAAKGSDGWAKLFAAVKERKQEKPEPKKPDKQEGLSKEDAAWFEQIPCPF